MKTDQNVQSHTYWRRFSAFPGKESLMIVWITGIQCEEDKMDFV